MEQFASTLSEEATKKLNTSNPELLDPTSRRLIANIAQCMAKWQHDFAFYRLITASIRCEDEIASRQTCETLSGISKGGWRTAETNCAVPIEMEKRCVFRHFCNGQAWRHPHVEEEPEDRTPEDVCYRSFRAFAWLLGPANKHKA